MRIHPDSQTPSNPVNPTEGSSNSLPAQDKTRGLSLSYLTSLPQPDAQFRFGADNQKSLAPREANNLGLNILGNNAFSAQGQMQSRTFEIY